MRISYEYTKPDVADGIRAHEASSFLSPSFSKNEKQTFPVVIFTNEERRQCGEVVDRDGKLIYKITNTKYTTFAGTVFQRGDIKFKHLGTVGTK